MSLWMCRPAAFRKDCCMRRDLLSSSKDSVPVTPQGMDGDVPSGQFNHTNEQVNSPLASIHILAQSITPVKMFLNHYQFVALLRMKDYLARLAGDLSKDVQSLGHSEESRTDSPSVCLSVLMEAIELTLLLPPAAYEPEAQSQEDTDTPSLTDSDLSPSHHAGEPGLLEDSGLGRNGETADHEDDEEQEGSVEEACEALEEGVGGQRQQQALVSAQSPQLSPGNSTVLSRQGSTFSLEGELSSALNATKGVTKDALSASLDLTKGALSITKDAFSILSRGSAMTKLFTPQNK